MKRILLIIIVLSAVCLSPKAQDNPAKLVLPKNEVKLSYGIVGLPNASESFTASYMFRITKQLWIGLDANYQSPSSTGTYRWREYYPDGSSQNFVDSRQDKFWALAPVLRIAYLNRKWATLYTGVSAGFGEYFEESVYSRERTNLHKDEYWHWTVTLVGGNWYMGRDQKFFVGGECNIGYKGLLSFHAGYRF
jgi:hypothetical protein